ncbi:CIC11C00000004529 [Sungouiella intermedia]|uniref:CIC11C00000002277 n=1 Tax=Sungouiella intermedia TaxID=45354 RepID=A0A1L0BP85_9ASCO|nr:CIC11C00000004529 [[Candida] intermedia]SGZ58565.1 CIC11C00000002277 [[Candida] intermedia]
MSEYLDPYSNMQKYKGGANQSSSTSPVTINHNVPNINIRQDSGSPVNAEFLSRSMDIKKQLSQSFQGTGTQGGVSKPHSRRNLTFHAKLEPDDENDPDEQGNERKRRDNINERIQELLTLIPEKYFQDNGQDGTGYDEGMAKNTGTKDGKPNKGQVLSKSVDYIQTLQNLIDENNRKEVELQLKLKTLQLKKQGKVNVPIQTGTTSAELALGEIGVGPHAEEYFKRVLMAANDRRN